MRRDRNTLIFGVVVQGAAASAAGVVLLFALAGWWLSEPRWAVAAAVGVFTISLLRSLGYRYLLKRHDDHARAIKRMREGV